ncbi:MAG TPA: tetratricopeptide repeat protein [Smithellaceae bacterium]|nr:tetratricopeptide repeat protein [Smithellaceae bacterium]
MRSAITVVLILTMALFAELGSASQFNENDYKENLVLASKGISAAQFNLGLMYDTGQGVPQDFNEAFKWYSLAAEQGNAAAQNNLGHLYHHGLGVSRDYEKALAWYRKAADQGDKKAKENIKLLLRYEYEPSSGPSNDFYQSLTTIKFSEPLYARLQKSDNGYAFVRFRMGHQPSKNEPWVNLMNAKPIWDTNKISCGKGLAGGVPNCSDIAVAEEMFQELDIDGRNLVARTVGAVFTLGTSLTGVEFKRTFKEELYKDAYEEALSKIDKEVLINIANEMDSLKSKYDDLTHIYNYAVANPKIDVIVKDHSGLYNDSLNFTKMVHIKKNEVSQLLQLEADSADDMLSMLIKSSQELKNRWQSKMAEAQVICIADNSENQFNYRLNCPEKYYIKTGELQGSIFVDIDSRNFRNIMPNTITAQDKVLKLSFDGNKIGLSNKSEYFITIQSVAFYYNNKIGHRSNLAVELPPFSELLPHQKLKIQDFPIDSDGMSFNDVTKAKAKKVNVTYGFAIKYKIVNTNQEKTLYSTKKYLLYDLVSIP